MSKPEQRHPKMVFDIAVHSALGYLTSNAKAIAEAA